MKALFFLGFLFFAQVSGALTCFEHNSGLLAAAVRDSDQIIFRFSASRGYDSIPQMEGPVGAHQIPLLNYQIESLRQIGSSFEIRIPLAHCDFEKASEGLFACNSFGKIAGTDLSFTSLSGFRVKTSRVSGEFEKQNFQLILSKTDTFFFLMPFPAGSCTGSL